MARKNKKTAPAQTSLLGADTAPADDLLRVNLAAPAERLHESRSRRRRGLVWTFIIVGTLTIGNGVGLMVNPPVPEIPKTVVKSSEVNFSLGKSAAHTKVTEWLATDPSPLPGGHIVSWDGFETIKGSKPSSSSDNPANDAELHQFTLATIVGGKTVFFDATVLVSVSPVLGAIAGPDPSLMPRVPAASQGWSSQVWAGYETATVPEAAVQSTVAWAKAFTESADALRLYVGDEREGHSYMPLQGARVLASTVTDAGFIKVEGESKPKVILARVQLTLAWSGAPDAKGSKATYDVRIEQAHTASPRIVAWGPSGTGPTLEKFGNAVTGTKLSTSSTDPVPTAPTPAPGGTGADATTEGSN